MTDAEAIAVVEFFVLPFLSERDPATVPAVSHVLALVRAQAATQEAPRASERRHGAGDPARPPSGPDLGGDDE